MDYAIDITSADHLEIARNSSSSSTAGGASGWLIEPGQDPSTFVRPSRLALDANIESNGRAPVDTLDRWQPFRESVWGVIASLIPVGGRVGIVGPGNGYDIPLREIAERASRVDLFDVDHRAVLAAVARLPEGLRSRCSIMIEDVTGGAANDIVAAARDLHAPLGIEPPRGPLGTGDYDLMLGDLIYGQLIGIGLMKSGVSDAVRDQMNAAYAPGIVTALMARMHASTPSGAVVHIHDLVGWSAPDSQTYTLRQVLDDPEAALPHLNGAALVDPCAYLADVSAELQSVHYWHWPFSDSHDYLVRAAVATTDS